MTFPAFWAETWGAALANHLWQSTVVVVIAWPLALALRKNRAGVRYWLWMAASVKFLLPFSLFIAAGGWLRSLIAAPIAAKPVLTSVMAQITEPFPRTQFLEVVEHPIATYPSHLLPTLLFAAWLCGVLIVALRWARAWRRIRVAVRTASPLALPADVPVLLAPTLLEPGIFGIFRPVLLLPEGIVKRLTPEQLRAIVAHEMCHVRRRDNLTFAIHMFVESLFWFHPAVWWIGTRLVEERERACDEGVLEAGSEAATYAEGILNVCKFYVELPMKCSAGVTGSDLKQRIVRILTTQGVPKLTAGRKMMLAVAGLVAVTLPVVLGLAQAMNNSSDWEKAAGGKQEFEVASVREDKSGVKAHSNFSLDNGNAYWVVSKDNALAPSGSLFSATEPLIRYIIFAYRLSGTQELALRFNYYEGLKLQVPDWVKNGGYEIEARAPGPATKDQMRLMMQSLLADRFKLAVHWETREAPVFALVPVNPGTLGPQLRPHPTSDDCATTPFPEDQNKNAPATKLPSTIPIPCGEIAHLPRSTPGSRHFGGRNVTLAMLAQSMPAQTGLVTLPRPVIDYTGLSGGFDFSMEWTPEDTNEVDNHETGGTFREALKNQLGLKLEPRKAPVEVLVIDHVEQPSPN